MVRKRRGKTIRTLLLFAAIVFVWWYGTYTLTVTSVTITSSKLYDEITIVQLTDLHGAVFGDGNQRLLEKIDGLSPDLVFVTGDMYTSGDDEGRGTAMALLTRLSESYAVYYVCGEHDKDPTYLEELADAGVHVLSYESQNITIGSTELCIYGIDNVYYSPTFDLANEFSLDKKQYNILLAHMQNFEKFAQFGMDLSVCGDTHGGQIRLPVFGAVYYGGAWFPEYDKEAPAYIKGLYTRDGSMLFISSGLGSYPFPVRFFNMPEIAVLHLEPGS